ncbi:MAG TPA: hypothetical protein VGG18_12990 [Granulicella sp.]
MSVLSHEGFRPLNVPREIAGLGHLVLFEVACFEDGAIALLEREAPAEDEQGYVDTA